MNATPADSNEIDDPAKGRRGFLAALGGLSLVWLGTLVYPVYRYLSPPPTTNRLGKSGKVKVDKITAAEVAQPGQGKNGGYAGRGLVVLRTQEGQLRAFDAKCTHAGCNVAFDGTRMACPCHGGIYENLSGKNVSGPPPRPLTELQVFVENGELYVSATNEARS